MYCPGLELCGANGKALVTVSSVSSVLRALMFEPLSWVIKLAWREVQETLVAQSKILM